MLAIAAGVDWAVLLLAFFLAGTVLTRYRGAEKSKRSGSVIEKAGARDAAQVAANGGAYAAAAIGFILTQDPRWMFFGVGALAASSADTWATEVGLLSAATPHSIISGKMVIPGTSGGVTIAGTLAALAGAGAIGSIALGLGWGARAAVAALAAGVAGTVLDSVMGATIQERRWCPGCERHTERRIHDCGVPTVGHGGVRWMRNDVVNGIASVAGGAVAAAMGAA